MKLTKKTIQELAEHIEKRIAEAGYGDVILADFLAQNICGYIASKLHEEAYKYEYLETWGLK